MNKVKFYKVRKKIMIIYKNNFFVFRIIIILYILTIVNYKFKLTVYMN